VEHEGRQTDRCQSRPCQSVGETHVSQMLHTSSVEELTSFADESLGAPNGSGLLLLLWEAPKGSLL